MPTLYEAPLPPLGPEENAIAEQIAELLEGWPGDTISKGNLSKVKDLFKQLGDLRRDRKFAKNPEIPKKPNLKQQQKGIAEILRRQRQLGSLRPKGPSL